MCTKDHLTLRLWRLKPTQAWAELADGLNLIFISRGAGECACGEAKQPLETGDVLVLPGGIACRLSPTNGSEMVFWTFSARLEDLFPLCLPAELRRVQSLIEGLKSPRLYSAADPAVARWHRLVNEVPFQINLEQRGRLLSVAAAVMTEELKNLRSLPGRCVSAAESVTSTSLDHLSMDEILSLSVSELAARFHRCERQLNRLFHAHFGLPVGALRMEMRLVKALSFLRCRDFKVCYVAQQCGFNSLSRFGICFKRRFGVSPSQWRATVIGPESRPPRGADSDPNCRLRAQGLCPWSSTPRTAKPVHGSLPVGARVRRLEDAAVNSRHWVSRSVAHA